MTHPQRTLVRLNRDQANSAKAPLWLWARLTAVALGGSLTYGASFGLVAPRWRGWRGGLWVAASAGLAWCGFGPALVWATRRNPLVLAQACLVTMAYGEFVLNTLASLNLIAWFTGAHHRLPMARLNLAGVGLSNIVMVVALASQLRAIGVQFRLTVALWFSVLRGHSTK